MNVLITGASGNLGRRLADRMEADGATVWRAMREEPDGERQLQLELGDPESVRAAIKASNPDQIIHLAAWVDVPSSFDDPAGVYNVNVLGTLEMLKALRERDLPTRLLYVSTSHVYGIPPEDVELIDEETPARPVSPYAASKLAAEDAVRLYGRISKIEPLVIRMFNVVGEGLPTTSVCSAIARRVLAVSKGEERCPLKVGNLKGLRDFIVLEDALDGILTTLEKGKVGETYNLCTGRGTSIEQILQELARVAGVEITTEVDPSLLRKVDPPRVIGSADKLERDTGFRASRPIEEAIAALYRDIAG